MSCTFHPVDHHYRQYAKSLGRGYHVLVKHADNRNLVHDGLLLNAAIHHMRPSGVISGPCGRIASNYTSFRDFYDGPDGSGFTALFRRDCLWRRKHVGNLKHYRRSFHRHWKRYGRRHGASVGKLLGGHGAPVPRARSYRVVHKKTLRPGTWLLVVRDDSLRRCPACDKPEFVMDPGHLRRHRSRLKRVTRLRPGI